MNERIFFLLIIGFSLCLTSGSLWRPAYAAESRGYIEITAKLSLENYNISTTGIGSNNATITWDTNINTNGTVEYGTTSTYGLSNKTDAFIRSHSIILNDLSSHVVYHYRVKSTTRDGVGNSSSDATFTTTYPTGTAVKNETATTTVSGVSTNTTASGTQQANISTSAGTGSSTVTVSTDHTSVTITNPATGWASMKYIGEDVVEDTTTDTYSVNNVQSVVMNSTPVEADLGGNIGTASAQIDVSLTKPITGVTIEQSIIQGATTDTTNAFQIAATGSDLDIKSVAYTVEFKNTALLNTNLSSAGVTLNLGVAHDWVVANGGRDNIKIFRFGDDGTKEVLTTTYTSSSGSTDYFKATSPRGLSTFGMTAVSSTSSGGGNNGGGSSGGSSTSSVSSSTASASNGGDAGPAAVSHAGPVQQALAPVVQEISKLLAPFQESGITTQQISVAGLTPMNKAGGKQAIRLATALAEKSGATISIMNHVITIVQPDFTLKVVTNDAPVNENGEISGTVSSTELATSPASASTSIGTVSFSLDTALAMVPESGIITTTISESVNPVMLSAYQSAALDKNRQIEDVAYNVAVEKTNLVTTGPATVMMTVPPEWVTTRGGTKSVGIVHIADDGTAELLTTDYSGIDKSGNIIFVATSPKGLSAFCLVSLKERPVVVSSSAGVPAPAPTPSQQPTGILQNIAGVTGRYVIDNLTLVIAIIALLLATGAGIILYDRRSDIRKRLRKKE